METLFRYADRLAGLEPLMLDNMKKKTSILSFHPTHVLAYKNAGNKIDPNTKLDNVMEFMKLQKQAHDAGDQKKQKPDGQKETEKEKKKKKFEKKKKNRNTMTAVKNYARSTTVHTLGTNASTIQTAVST